MEVKCGGVTLPNQHVMVALRFLPDGTYAANVALDNKRFAGIQDQASEIFRAGMNATVAWLQEWENNNYIKEEQQ